MHKKTLQLLYSFSFLTFLFLFLGLCTSFYFLVFENRYFPVFLHFITAAFIIFVLSYLFYFNTALHHLVKFILSMLILLGIHNLFIYLILPYFYKFLYHQQFALQNKTVIIMNVLMALIFTYVQQAMNRSITGFKHVSFLYEIEKKEDEDEEKYLKRLSGFIEKGEKGLKPSWYLSIYITNLIILVFFIIAAFIHITSMKYLYSVFLFFYTVFGLIVYLYLFQLLHLTELRFYNFKIHPDTFKTWNYMIRLFILISLFLSVLIPWNYEIVPSRLWTKYLTESWMISQSFLIDSQEAESEKKADSEFNLKENEKTEEQLEKMRKRNQLIHFLIQIVSLIIIGYLLLIWIFGKILIYYYRKNALPKRWGWLMIQYTYINGVIVLFFKFGFRLYAIFIQNLLPKRNKLNKEPDELLQQHFFQMFQNSERMTEDKKNEMFAIVRDFSRLIQTASKILVPFHYSYGPSEYLEMVAEKEPELSARLKTISTVFNKSRYSLHLLSDRELNHFNVAINESIDYMLKDDPLNYHSDTEAPNS